MSKSGWFLQKKQLKYTDMKVLCIKDRDEVHGFHDVHPFVGEECVVIESKELPTRAGVKILCYKLVGYPPKNGYNAENFSPISNIDETEMERNYNELLTTK